MKSDMEATLLPQWHREGPAFGSATAFAPPAAVPQVPAEHLRHRPLYARQTTPSANPMPQQSQEPLPGYQFNTRSTAGKPVRGPTARADVPTSVKPPTPPRLRPRSTQRVGHQAARSIERPKSAYSVSTARTRPNSSSTMLNLDFLFTR